MLDTITALIAGGTFGFSLATYLRSGHTLRQAQANLERTR